MTFKLLIVDDEPIIRRGLASTIPWEDYGIEIIGTAHDGEDAIKKLKKESVDLVITDVRMPNKDGLQLAAYIEKFNPNTSVIMLSGYDEFKYAQQAIQLGVKNYLLKPVDIHELLKVVEKITEEIRKSREEINLKKQTSLRNTIYQQLFDYPIQGAERKDLKGLEDVKVFPFISMLKDYPICEENKGKEALKAYKQEWEDFIEKHLTTEHMSSVSAYIGENLLLTCVLADSEGLLDRLPLSFSGHTMSQSGLFLFNSENVHLKNLSQEVNHLKKKMNYLPINSEGIFYYTDSISPREENENNTKEIETKLTNAITQSDQKQIDLWTNTLFSTIKSNQFLLEETVALYRRIINKVLERFKALKPEKENNRLFLYFNRDLDQLLLSKYEHYKELFLKDIDRVVYEFQLKELDNKDWLIARAIDYIKSYYKSDIKALEVAGVINISPNYFSSLFKQKTGKNFNEYVNQLRVEEAKILLEETPYKVSEISEQVGFQEYKYFVEVFKRFLGMTPTNYRKFKSIK